MDVEKLKKGNDLAEELKKLYEERKRWEKVQEDKKVYGEWTLHGGNGSTVKTKYINLDVLCVLTLDTINKEIAEKEEEFNNL